MMNIKEITPSKPRNNTTIKKSSIEMVSDQQNNAQMSHQAHMKFIQQRENTDDVGATPLGSNTGVKLHRLAVKPPQQDHKSLHESSSKRSKNFFLLDGQQQEPQNTAGNLPDSTQADRPVLITKMRNSDLQYNSKKRSIFSLSKQ